MSDQTARTSDLAIACIHCGGRIPEPAAFCPHCGAPLAAHASVAMQAEGGQSAPMTRFEPPARSFASTDFEGDLDAPSGAPPDLPAAMPESEPYGGAGGARFAAWRQWGLKSGVGLALAAGVVLAGSLTVLHRYDDASNPAGLDKSAWNSADGSTALNGSEESNLNGSANDAARAADATGQGAGTSASGAVTPPVANAGTQRAQTGRAGAGQRRHLSRGRAHAHSHAKIWHRPTRDTTYLHSDVRVGRWFG
ncbi:zinc ribbon domain-containing protein [Trinickia dabaoshanensis]|nr:zinc ribbon domain-containing protein [Trinickia dabaoshanensis]